jgi:Lrp/AsnC family leucine-responsive transcriptional regulator
MIRDCPQTFGRKLILCIDDDKRPHCILLWSYWIRQNGVSVYYELDIAPYCRNSFDAFSELVLNMNLDRKDFVLLDALRQNASRRLEDLAGLVKLAPSSVHERLRRLERDGIIRKWTLDVDAAALGLGVVAFIGIRATRPCSELLDAIKKIPSIEECHSVAGELSMILKARVRDTAALLSLSEHLRQIPGIEQTETTIVLKTQIERPIALLPPATSHTK